jgi:hypothetical protein
MIRTISFILAALSFIFVIGGAVYEHLAVVPIWSAAVPASLAMFQGPHALTPQNFWIPIHPTTLSLMTAALLLNWKTERRKFILSSLVGYVLILAITAVYFVPELMALTQTTYSSIADIELTRRASLWESLSLARLAFLISLAVVLLLGLSKADRTARFAD